MKAIVRDRYGPPDVVRLEDVETPVPGEGEVLVRVEAASVNRADIDNLYPRWAFTRLFLGLRAPRERRLGVDVAGVVESVGPGATRFRPGDAVFADLFAFGQGAFAEYVCAPERAFASMPAEMPFEESAALPHSAILALQALRLRNGRSILPGDRVLVVGASGNVGPFAVQMAKARGAEVTGVCRTDKVDLVRSLGADHVIDYSRVDYTRTGERYDWIVDVEARHPLLRWRHSLRPNGVYVSLGGSTWRILEGMLLAPLISKAVGRSMGLMLWWKPFDPDDVAALKALVAAGSVRPVIGRRYPLDRVVDALRDVDEGRARGKVVITISAAPASGAAGVPADRDR